MGTAVFLLAGMRPLLSSPGLFCSLQWQHFLTLRGSFAQPGVPILIDPRPGYGERLLIKAGRQAGRSGCPRYACTVLAEALYAGTITAALQHFLNRQKLSGGQVLRIELWMTCDLPSALLVLITSCRRGSGLGLGEGGQGWDGLRHYLVLSLQH